MRYCENCGTPLKANAKFCSACGKACTQKGANQKTMVCKNCESELNEDDLFCVVCGEPCCTLDEFESGQFGSSKEAKSSPKIEIKKSNAQKSREIRILCLSLLGACAILWLAAPFAAINILTLGNQPTALQIVTDDVIHIGDITESIPFWAAIVSICGIVICCVSTLADADGVTCVVAILSELPLLLVLFDMMGWADEAGEFLDAMGIGFWGIFILLWIVVFASASNTGKATD